MLNQNGLSLDQAPPLFVVFRFFFVGAIFGIIAGVLILFFQTSIFEGSSTEAIIITHTLTLGVMLSFMLGSLFQMLPVLAGVKISAPTLKANLVLFPFVVGTITLLLAFKFTENSWLFIIASLLLTISLLGIVFLIIKNLFLVQNHTISSKGIIYTLLSLGFVILFALYLTSSLSGLNSGMAYLAIKKAHYSFGLFGWISLLIISISFQVIEMFYVTPSYPKFFSHFMPLALFVVLIFSAVIGIFYPLIWKISDVAIIILLGSYGVLTLQRFNQRKRPISDGTLWFWRIGLSSLLISLFSLFITIFIENIFLTSLSYILFTTFALSIIFAMFYKIVPFLTWFHLNSQGYIPVPMMHTIIHPKNIMKHLYLHILTIISFILSLVFSPFIFLAGVLMVLSFGTISYHLIKAFLIYRKTQKTGKKFTY